MPFSQVTNRVPTSIGKIEIVLSHEPAYVDEDGITQPEERTARFQIEVLDQDGERIRPEPLRGNLIPHLTTGEITAITNFMNSLRARAETEILT